MEPKTDERLYAIDVVVVQQPTAPGRSVPPPRYRVVTAWLSELVIEATTAPGRLLEGRGGPLLALLRRLPARLHDAQELDLLTKPADLLARERGLVLGERREHEIRRVALGGELDAARPDDASGELAWKE